MADPIQNLTDLADEYSIQDPRRLYQLARSQGANVTQSHSSIATGRRQAALRTEAEVVGQERRRGPQHKAPSRLD